VGRLIMPLTCMGIERAGDRDRTGMTSLEGWGSTIELRPRDGACTSRSGRPSRVAYRLRLARRSPAAAAPSLTQPSEGRNGPDRTGDGQHRHAGHGHGVRRVQGVEHVGHRHRAVGQLEVITLVERALVRHRDVRDARTREERRRVRGSPPRCPGSRSPCS
jgi:hypothetical protein